MRRNRLRELLDAGQPTLGTHLHISWPSIVELVGHSKMFDYVEFVAEYAPYDLYALENIGRAIDLFDHLSGMMKIEQDPRTYLTIRAIGSGIQNVLFADPRSGRRRRSRRAGRAVGIAPLPGRARRGDAAGRRFCPRVGNARLREVAR